MIETITNNVFFQKILLVTLITILPLIPAYILFKFLPAKSIVTGPFKGLNIDFSGATAIYFIIFVTIFTTSQFWQLEGQDNTDQKDFEVWEVEGQIKAENVQNYGEEGFKLTVIPEEKPLRNGQFSVTILRERDNTTDEMEFPALHISDTDEEYMPRTISLQNNNGGLNTLDYNIQRIDSINTIRINKPIPLIENIDE